jgi:hypothetical protein
MNAAIIEFWENHNPQNPPKNEKWIRDKYPNAKLPSDAIIKAMCTIMRPEKYK